MQLPANAPTAILADTYRALQDAIYAIEMVDVSIADDAAVELIRDRRNQVAYELNRRGLRECGVCKTARPGAVDWGCQCDVTADEAAQVAHEFAAQHD